MSRNAWDTNLAKVNSKFLSVNLEAGGGGQFALIPLESLGKQATDAPCFGGHTGAVLDTDFNPYNDHVIASCAEDCKVLIWSIPEGGLKENCNTPQISFTGHNRKVGHVLFNPVAENILLSSAADLIVKIYDIGKGAEKQDIALHGDVINSICWNYNGSLIATTTKEKKLRVIDVRANKVAMEQNCHPGIKGNRVTFCGETDKIVTTGFSKTSDRQYAIWDVKNSLSEPLKCENLDTSSGGLIPFYDNDTKMLYLAGKGDGNIRYFEVVDDTPFLYYLTEYKSADPQRGIAFLPKRACNIQECEIARAFKVHPDRVEPISFRVPRKSDQFQADIYPDTLGDKPALTAEQWLKGKTSNPILISLEKGFQPAARKEFVPDGTNAAASDAKVDPLKFPQTEKEYQEAFHHLRKENENLKNELAQKEVRIRQLEMQSEKK